MNYVEALREFQKAVFVKSGHWPADIGQTFIVNNETARLREFLHNEEAAELNDVLIGSDDDTSKAHLLKEICDLLYVVFGTAVSYGIPIDEVFSEVHRSNMSKSMDKNEIGKTVKGESYSPPNIRPILFPTEV